MDWLTTLLGFAGNLLPGLFQSQATRQAGAQQASASQQSLAEQRRQFDESMRWMREAAGLSQEGTELENIRRSQEAQRRAARLEDVAAMFGDVQGMAGMRDIAQRLMPGGEADLRKAAMRELERGSGQLGAMLASQGLTGSGYGAQQQRALAGDVTMGLANQIAQNRMQQLAASAGILGQLTSADLARLGSIAQIYQDEAFGADLPYNPQELRDLYREMTGGGATVTQPAEPGAPAAGGGGAAGVAPGNLPAGMTETDFEATVATMWNTPDETGTPPSRRFDSFGEWLDYIKGTPARFMQAVDQTWRRVTAELGLRERQAAMPEFAVGTPAVQPRPGASFAEQTRQTFAPVTPAPTPSFSVRTPVVTAPITAGPITTLPVPTSPTVRVPVDMNAPIFRPMPVTTPRVGTNIPGQVPNLTERDLMNLVSM